MPGLLFLVTGSREYEDMVEVERWGQGLPAHAYLMDGMSRGADNMAFNGFYRTHPGAQSLRRPARWDQQGKTAGFLRNAEMVQECALLQSEGWTVEIHAFWNGKSAGTQNTIECALASGFAVTVHVHGQETQVWKC